MGLTTFSTALSGLATNSQGLNVVGNNLANLNTVGFKASTISFTDVMGQMFSTAGTAESGNVMTIGLGSQVSSVRHVMTQGSLQTTSNPLDVAIQGKGLLAIRNNNGQFYTRAGNLHIDVNGFLVTDSGAFVQGYSRNAVTGQIDNNLGVGSIRLPSGSDNPIMTSALEMAMNLDGNAPDGAQFSAAIQIYDSLGNPHTATVTMEKEISGGSTPTTMWRFDITIPNNEIAGVAATDTSQFSLITGAVASGSPSAGALLFDSSGNLTSAWTGADPSTPPPLANVTFPSGSVALPAMGNGAVLSPSMTWTLVGSSNSANVTGYAGTSEITASVQNGAAAGTLTNLSIGPDGVIFAIFNNGQTSPVGQIVLAQFNNIDGLIEQGGGLYAESIASGAAFFGVPGEGGRGPLLSGTLEQSNVDLAAELTRIITYQRAYQANARMVTVTDQIMQETMNIRQ